MLVCFQVGSITSRCWVVIYVIHLGYTCSCDSDMSISPHNDCPIQNGSYKKIVKIEWRLRRPRKYYIFVNLSIVLLYTFMLLIIFLINPLLTFLRKRATGKETPDFMAMVHGASVLSLICKNAVC